jgi:hypothetical protein
LFILGIFTFVRLVQTSIEAAVLSLQIQRIRGYYRTLVPEAQRFFDPPGTRDALAVAMATSGNRASPVEMLFTAAAMIAAVNSILGGAGLALLAGKLLLVRDWSVGAGPWPRLAWYVVITGYACDARDGSPLIGGKPFPPPLDARPVTASTCDTYSVIDADANERAGDIATIGAVGNYASPSPANLFHPRHPS